jgi:hypothetical protein
MEASRVSEVRVYEIGKPEPVMVLVWVSSLSKGHVVDPRTKDFKVVLTPAIGPNRSEMVGEARLGPTSAKTVRDVALITVIR